MLQICNISLHQQINETHYEKYHQLSDREMVCRSGHIFSNRSNTIFSVQVRIPH